MKQKSMFVCTECGYVCGKWMGKCPECGAWNSFVEQVVSAAASAPSAAAAAERAPVPLQDIRQVQYRRILTGIPELDRVLGGGVVPGSAILVGGDPGIGKSTLLLQMCNTLQLDGGKILYVTGEESKEQVGMRAARLNVNNPNLYILAETDLDAILSAAAKLKPQTMIIDSIQTVNAADIQSGSGSVAQVRECAARLIRFAKTENTALFLVGHVNKEGSIAGPKILEHMVDAVLYFEGEKRLLYRVVRTVKNRFGPTSELGVFEMASEGLVGVDNPSMLFLSGRPEEVSGVCVCCVMEGTRPLFAEIQALTTPTPFPAPRRVTAGIDYNKLCLLIAVLEKRAGIILTNFDAYINVAGGVKLDDPAADLAVALAIASGLKDFVIDDDVAAIGEIGLAGEVRPVWDIERRIKEGARLGFHRFIVSDKNKPVDVSSEIQILRVKDIRAAVRAAGFGGVK